MATNPTGKPKEEKKDNVFKKAGRWLWDNKWGLLGAFATGAAAGVAGDRVANHFLGNKDKGGPTPPTEL